VNKTAYYPKDELSRINVDRIKKIHTVSTKYGKTFSTGVRDAGSLVQIATEIERLIDHQKEMDLLMAVAMERVIKYHPFWDGNHRTAFELGRFICVLFGYRIDVTVDEAVTFMRKIDDKDLSTKQIRQWIKKRVIPMKEL
jgi:death-on-curing family protein